MFIKLAILIGFGVPILTLSTMIVCFACAMQKQEVAKNG